jgi:hypothetical protein
MFKLYLSLLIGSLMLASCGAVSSVPAPASPTVEANRSLSGRTIATIANQDLAYPALSPDGKTLAYSEVLVENGVENIAVQLYNLQTGQVTTLLDREKAQQYKTYSVYVSHIDWQQTDRLEVQQLARFDDTNAMVKSVYQSADHTLFMVKIHPSYEKGDNPLFV